MKKITTFLLILVCLNCFSQADTVKITVSIQARDCEYIGDRVAFNGYTEDLFDSLKAKFRVPVAPTGTTVVTISGIRVKEWLIVAYMVKSDYVAQGASVASRIDADLRAASNSFLTSKLDEYDAIGTAIYTNTRTSGRFKLKKQ